MVLIEIKSGDNEFTTSVIAFKKAAGNPDAVEVGCYECSNSDFDLSGAPGMTTITLPVSYKDFQEAVQKASRTGHIPSFKI